MTTSMRFVVGVDGSDEARRCLRWAIREAAAWDAQLDVVHAWSPPVSFGPTSVGLADQTILDSLRRSAEDLVAGEVAAGVDEVGGPSVQIETLITNDGAGAALLDAANGADLLVVGSRGRGGFVGLLLGSVSNHCVHNAPCPVVVVRGERPEVPPAGQPRRVVAGIDGSDDSLDALRWALDEAARTDADLAVVMAWSWLEQPGEFDPGYGADDVQDAAGELLARAQDTDARRGARTEIRAINDHPARALVDASADADLLVVGSRGLGALRRVQLGSVSTHCVRHADCPVAVIRRA